MSEVLKKHFNGKGSKYRIPNTDKQFQENYNKIFKKKKDNVFNK